LIFSIATLGFAQQCQTISCAPGIAEEGQNCYSSSPKTFVETFTTCDTDLVCDNFYTQDCVIYSNAIRKTLPGAACWINDQCASAKCNGGYCIGSLIGTKCLESIECDVGLYCNPMGTCDTVLQLNSACKSNADCRIDLVCDYGTCLKMFSIAPGQKTSEYGVDVVGFLSPYQTLSCSSGWAYPINASEPLLNKVCASSAPTIVNRTAPYKCKNQLDACTYAFTGTNFTFNISCSCSNEANGGAYCPIIPANERNYTAVVQDFVMQATHCSTSAKNNWMMCGDVLRDSASWKDLISIYYEAYKWNSIVNTVECVKHSSSVVIYWWSQENVQPIIDNANLVTIATGMLVAIVVAFISI